MALRTLYEYRKIVENAAPAPTEKSGIQCPNCAPEPAELDWAERQLFSREPAMRRLICQACGWSEVVPCLPAEASSER